MKQGLLITVILFWAVNVFAQQPENHPATVLSVPFDNATSEKSLDGLRNGIPDLLTAYLSPYSGHIQFVDRENVQAVFKEQGLDFSGYLQKNSLHELGKMVQAGYILRGSFDNTGGALNITVLLYDTQTTQLVKSFSAGGDAQHVSDLCQKLADEMSKYFKFEIKKITGLPPDPDPVKNALYIQAMGDFYNGQYPRAIAGFIKIRELDPRDEAAQLWLARTYQENGMTDHAVIEYEEFLKNFPHSDKTGLVNKELAQISGTH